MMFYRLLSKEFSSIELYFDLQMFPYMTLRTNYINTFDHVIHVSMFLILWIQFRSINISGSLHNYHIVYTEEKHISNWASFYKHDDFNNCWVSSILHSPVVSVLNLSCCRFILKKTTNKEFRVSKNYNNKILETRIKCLDSLENQH